MVINKWKVEAPIEYEIALHLSFLHLPELQNDFIDHVFTGNTSIFRGNGSLREDPHLKFQTEIVSKLGMVIRSYRWVYTRGELCSDLDHILEITG